jgi:transposase InsO family protein
LKSIGQRLGIRIQRIQPGKPQQNGRHERIHLTLKKEATKPAFHNFLQQQERFERLFRFTTMNALIRRCGVSIPLKSIHPTPENMLRHQIRNILFMSEPYGVDLYRKTQN